MLHGFLASGDTYANTTMRFTSNGYCEDRIFVYDWNSIGGGNNVNALDQFIDNVLSQTNADKVELAGHSAGSGYCYNYLSTAAHAAKVAHYVHLAGNPTAGPAGPSGEVPTLNIYSTDDMTVAGGNIPGATNLQLNGADHYQVATGTATFDAMYRFFNNDEAPATTAITRQNWEITVSGKVLTLGENEPRPGATINVYPLDPLSGERLTDSNLNYTLTADPNGHWGPITLLRSIPYEFQTITNVAGDRPVVYYREGFNHNNPLVYLRTLPPSSSIAGLLLNGLPSDDNQTVMAVFTASQATVSSRDTLIVDNNILSTPQFAPATETAIAFFLYDSNNNSQTDNSSIFTFGLTPFLAGVDMFFHTEPRYAIHLEFNGRSMYVPSIKSQTDGIVVAVFD